MRAGDTVKVRVEGISSDMTQDELRHKFGEYGTVQSVSWYRGYAEITYTANGTRLIDSSGIGELRLCNQSLRVFLT